MSILQWIKSRFQSKQSVLSDPKSQFLDAHHMRCLIELNWLWKITANRFNKLSTINSADRRINELYHFWYVDVEICKNYFLYSINEKWINLIK